MTRLSSNKKKVICQDLTEEPIRQIALRLLEEITAMHRKLKARDDLISNQRLRPKLYQSESSPKNRNGQTDRSDFVLLRSLFSFLPFQHFDRLRDAVDLVRGSFSNVCRRAVECK